MRSDMMQFFDRNRLPDRHIVEHAEQSDHDPAHEYADEIDMSASIVCQIYGFIACGAGQAAGIDCIVRHESGDDDRDDHPDDGG